MAAQVGSATLPLLSARRRRPRDALHQILIGQLRNRDWYLLSERRSRWPGRSAGCRPVPSNRARQKARQPASPRSRTRSSNPVPSAGSQVRTSIGPPELAVAPPKQAQAPSSTGGPRVRIHLPPAVSQANFRIATLAGCRFGLEALL